MFISETELLNRCQSISGWTFFQLAQHLNLVIPNHPLQRKGWLGQAVEYYLGANAGNHSLPDFTHLDIELKTIPLNHKLQPIESTYITRVPLQTEQHKQFEESDCYHKLKKILWIPIEGDPKISYACRRIGQYKLWSPSEADLKIIKQDWQHFSLLIETGRWSEIDATMGEYLQIRPKAAHSKILCDAYDTEGKTVKTMPRGFYLRAKFTKKIF